MNAISQISSEMSAALALDLAADIWPEADVFANHGLDPVYGSALLQQDWFSQMVEEARREWSSITNAKQRIRLKSQIAVESSIEELFSIVHDAKTPAAARVAAFKELKDLSGAAVPDATLGGANGPVVNIVFNGEAMTIASTGQDEDENDRELPNIEYDVEGEYVEATEVTRSDLGEELGVAPL